MWFVGVRPMFDDEVRGTMMRCGGAPEATIDHERRNTKYRHRVEYEILREYGTSTMYDESAVCRCENYTKDDT